LTDKITVALAQLNLVVGDVAGNTARILEYSARARDELRADLVVFPELSVSGYPPEDLLFHTGLRRRVGKALDTIRESVRDIAVLFGYPEYQGDDIYNACAVYLNGKILATYRKQMLPNYRVFDEQRYFKAGKDAAVFRLNGVRIGLNICEDVWKRGPAAASRSAGAEVLVAINGSPYELASQQNREDVVRSRILEIGIPAVYLNLIGGQDELVFDGGSFTMDADGQVCFRAPPFSEGLHRVVLEVRQSGIVPEPSGIVPIQSTEQSVYEALVCGTRDYVDKHGFPGVVLGLSGGIDSALILAIACDALGAKRVRAVMMPFR
jgi:NAD+ synthase (glutamine-hydrolysing)